MATSNRKVFVFGGNGFMGSTAVQHLLQLGYQVTCLNRGNSYWHLAESNQGLSFKCDRLQGLHTCKELQQHLETTEYDAIVDFSGYEPQVVRDAVTFFRGKFKLYVYVSSDSVYEVCVPKPRDGGTTELDAIRPSDPQERDALFRLESYGDLKLQCEEELLSLSQSEQFPYVALRLPDVIGPQDTLMRWWYHQTWLGLAHFYSRKMEIPKWLFSQPLSFVYAKDVARIVALLLDDSSPDSHFVRVTKGGAGSDAYNVGFRETVTMPELIFGMAELTGIPKEQIAFEVVEDSQDSHKYYPDYLPSVKRGPIDVSKALNKLNFTPTPWSEAFRETVRFFHNALFNAEFKNERDQLCKLLKQAKIIEKDEELFNYISSSKSSDQN